MYIVILTHTHNQNLLLKEKHTHTTCLKVINIQISTARRPYLLACAHFPAQSLGWDTSIFTSKIGSIVKNQ